MSSGGREYQKAISYLYSLIESGALAIGSRLPTERSISETLSISRNSTREALRVLENMGIIESRQGSGNYIVDNTLNNIIQIIDIMLMLKQTTADEICMFRRSMEKAVCMSIIEQANINRWKKKLNDIILQYDLAQSIEEQIEADRNFHCTLILATENHFWISMFEAVVSVYRRWIDAVIRKSTDAVKVGLSECHKEMVDALCSGSREACEKAIDRHYHIVDQEMKGNKK